MSDITVEVRGLAETQRKLEQVVRDLHGPPILIAMRTATLSVQGEAKKRAPVDTGRLRSSITPEIRNQTKSVQGVVGSNVSYAPLQEFGTGVFAGNEAYFPPPSALDVWARRHGFINGFVVARAIFRRGGTKGKRYLRGAFEAKEVYIKHLLGEAVERIVTR